MTAALQAAGHGVWIWQVGDDQIVLPRPWKRMLGSAAAKIGTQTGITREREAETAMDAHLRRS